MWGLSPGSSATGARFSSFSGSDISSRDIRPGGTLAGLRLSTLLCRDRVDIVNISSSSFYQVLSEVAFRRVKGV